MIFFLLAMGLLVLSALAFLVFVTAFYLVSENVSRGKRCYKCKWYRASARKCFLKGGTYDDCTEGCEDFKPLDIYKIEFEDEVHS